MDMTRATSRRAFLRESAGVSVAVAFGTLAVSSAQAGGHMPKLSVDDPAAKPLGYVLESAKPDQLCSNCQLYTGEAGKDYGPCQIFPGKEVAAKGWCTAWVKKAG